MTEVLLRRAARSAMLAHTFAHHSSTSMLTLASSETLNLVIVWFSGLNGQDDVFFSYEPLRHLDVQRPVTQN